MCQSMTVQLRGFRIRKADSPDDQGAPDPDIGEPPEAGLSAAPSEQPFGRDVATTALVS